MPESNSSGYAWKLCLAIWIANALLARNIRIVVAHHGLLNRHMVYRSFNSYARQHCLEFRLANAVAARIPLMLAAQHGLLNMHVVYRSLRPRGRRVGVGGVQTLLFSWCAQLKNRPPPACSVGKKLLTMAC